MSILLLATFSVAIAQIPTTYAEVAQQSGLELQIADSAYTWQARSYRVEAQPAPAEALRKYEPLFVKEWQRYPASLFKKARVRKLFIGAKLSMNGQFRAAVPAFENETMFYDAELGSHRPDYQRVVIHHELFHMIDQRMGTMRRDPEWAELNPKDFRYGDGGHLMRTNGAGELTDKLPGLLTPYGASAVEEDKAELFAHLLVNPDFVQRQAEKDPVLAKKIELLKKRLLNFDENMGASFWRPSELDAAVLSCGFFQLQIPNASPHPVFVLR